MELSPCLTEVFSRAPALPGA